MRLGFCLLPATLAAGFGLLALPATLFAQEPDSRQVAVNELPEAPQPQFAPDAVEPLEQQAPTGQSQGSSSSQTGAPQPGTEKNQHEKAKEQIKEEEHQRILGIAPAFNTSYRGSEAVSMTAGQKMGLAFRSSVDPFTFAAGFLVAGYHEAKDDDKGFGWGLEGYGKRSGAAYLDAVDGTMIGNGILPVILHQDPRYFRMGQGTKTHRLLYAMATTAICKHDNRQVGAQLL